MRKLRHDCPTFAAEVRFKAQSHWRASRSFTKNPIEKDQGIDFQCFQDGVKAMLRLVLASVALAVTLAVAGASQAQIPDAGCGSYLYEPAYHLDHKLRGAPRPYMPQPGDIMLYTDSNWFWEVTHDLAGAFEPHGSGIVVRRPDGVLGTLEAGPNDTFYVRVLETLPHLKEYECNGPVWIRQRKTPLTPEQSEALTAFAMRPGVEAVCDHSPGANDTPSLAGTVADFFPGQISRRKKHLFLLGAGDHRLLRCVSDRCEDRETIGDVSARLVLR